MTLIDDRETWNEFERAPRLEVGGGHFRTVSPTRRPQSRRPAGAPMNHRGTGVLVSRASHRRRPITPVTTVALALVAAAITLWLGLVAQSGGVSGVEAEIPSRLAVVQVHSGESLQHVAQRVAPDAPVSEVVERIRELNKLESVVLDAGQTLIAPVA
ncbi:LysM peptidoglycan-binding domain-containing protein [Mycobacterium sp. pW049]|uniref:LysM peptidoglycan-binding domain-containing protein n=1 Tax=[Mycobacterium] bulgaricum TaxID=3238985 RepID=UPI00351BCFBF